MNYSQEELNQILLYKKIEDFFIAIVENRKGILSDKEYEKIIGSDNIVYTGASKEEVENISRRFQDNNISENITSKLMKMLYGFSQIRRMSILTTIGDELYDIANAEFVDLKRNKIIFYDSLTNYCDKTNARTKLFTPNEEPQLKENLVLLDVDDPTKIQAFEKEHINQKGSKDLTSCFIKEARKEQQEQPKKLSKK